MEDKTIGITCQYPLPVADPKCGKALDYNHSIYCHEHAQEAKRKEEEHMVHYKDRGWVNEPRQRRQQREQ